MLVCFWKTISCLWKKTWKRKTTTTTITIIIIIIIINAPNNNNKKNNNNNKCSKGQASCRPLWRWGPGENWGFFFFIFSLHFFKRAPPPSLGVDPGSTGGWWSAILADGMNSKVSNRKRKRKKGGSQTEAGVFLVLSGGGGGGGQTWMPQEPLQPLQSYFTHFWCSGCSFFKLVLHFCLFDLCLFPWKLHDACVISLCVETTLLVLHFLLRSYRVAFNTYLSNHMRSA